MHFVVHDYVMYNDELTLQEKCLFSYIEGFHDNQEKTFYASNKHISKLLNVSVRRVSSIVSSLQDKGYISVEYQYVNSTKEIKNRFLYLNDLRLREMKSAIETSVVGGIEESFHTVVKKPSTNNKVDIVKKKKDFDLWYSNYPRKTGKAPALTYWIKNYDTIIKEIDMEHCKKAYEGREKQYIPHASTYLNQKRWEDEIVQHIPKKEKINLEEYKMSTTGHYIGYCDSCDESAFYKQWDLGKESSCCTAKINPKKKVNNGIKRQPNIQQDCSVRAVL